MRFFLIIILSIDNVLAGLVGLAAKGTITSTKVIVSQPNGILSGVNTELAIILGGIILLFRWRKIPELIRGLGQGIKNFKNAVKEDDEQMK